VVAVLKQMLPRLRELLAALLPNLPQDDERPAFIRQAQQRGRWV
jgi:hypothetical protein